MARTAASTAPLARVARAFTANAEALPGPHAAMPAEPNVVSTVPPTRKRTTAAWSPREPPARIEPLERWSSDSASKPVNEAAPSSPNDLSGVPSSS